MDPKIFLSGFSTGKNWKKEIQTIASQMKKGLKGASCDLAVFFVSEAYQDFDAKTFAQLLKEELLCRVSLGCNSSGVIANETEIEMEPAISVLAMHLPGVKINPFYVSADNINSLSGRNELINVIDVYPPDMPKFICLADPNSCDINKFLTNFNDAYKGLPVIGGLASGMVMGAPNWLCLNGNVYTEGLVGVALVGNIEFDVIVSQGSRPIGSPYVVTRAEGNVLYELAGRPALDVVRNMVEGLSSKDKKLAEFSLSVGLVMNELQTHFKRGDFLIRNLVGFDPDTKSLMVGATLKVGQTLQFQVRDAETSAQDLDHMLEMIHKPSPGPRGAMLVSCCGRGRDFYGKADHDIQVIQQAQGPLPVTGFFANGEIGPVGLKNFMHGYTSSLVIFR